MRLAQKLTLTLVGGLILIVVIMAAYPYFITEGAVSKTRSTVRTTTTKIITTTALQDAKSVALAQSALITSYMTNNNVTTVQKLLKDPVIRGALSKIYYSSNPQVIKARIGILIMNSTGVYLAYYKMGSLKPESIKDIASKSEGLVKLINNVTRAGTATFVSGIYKFGNSERFGAFYIPSDQPIKETRIAIWVDIPRGSYVTNAFGELTEQDFINSILQELEPIRKAIGTSVFVGAILSILTIFVLVYRVNKDISLPIVKLAEVSNSIADGEIEATVPYQDRDDEIGILAKAIERVRRSLEIAVKTLEEFT